MCNEIKQLLLDVNELTDSFLFENFDSAQLNSIFCYDKEAALIKRNKNYIYLWQHLLSYESEKNKKQSLK